MENRKSCRLVFVLYPFQGHINPMLQLATILHSRGFSITLVHPQFNSPNPSNHPEFTFIPILDNLSDIKVSTGVFSILSALNKNCEAPFKQCIEQLVKADGHHDRISCIVYDGLMFFAQSVADYFKLPGISVRTGPAATILAFALFPRLHEQGYISLLDLMSQAQALEIESLRLKELTAVMRENTTEGMLELIAAMTDSLKKSSAIIVNTMNFLEQEAVKIIQEIFPAPSIFTAGPFHKLAPTISSSLLKEDTNCISWLNRQASNSVIYVSFGSMASIDEKELLETAWGLANSEQPFLWVIRPGMVRDSKGMELLPKSFENRVGERGFIVEWAPQKEVLEHEAVGGFWTHCGWNSILESISEGVPMLCRPFSGDQNLNVRYVCDVWNVGLELESGKIEKDIRKLMVDTEGEEMRKRAKHLKQKVDMSLKEGGSSHNSLNDLAVKILSF